MFHPHRSAARHSPERAPLPLDRQSQKVPDWYTARRVAERVYGFKTLTEEGSGCSLGAHLVGPHADEVINIFGLASRHGLTVEDLKQQFSPTRPARPISATCFRVGGKLL